MSSTDIPMPVLPWAERQYPPLPDPPASEPREPRRLGPIALLEFRDSMHEDSVMYAASGAEIDLWLAQLDEAIGAGQVDPRPIWELEAEREAERVAAIVLKRLGGSPTAAEIAAAALRMLGPAVRAEFVTETNAEGIFGQNFDWVASLASRLGVPVPNPTGKKRLIDIQALRIALAAAAPNPGAKSEDAVAQIHRILAAKVNGGSHAR